MPTLGWMILMAIGLASTLSMWLFNRWLEKQKTWRRVCRWS
jgi:hypothetical protein